MTVGLSAFHALVLGPSMIYLGLSPDNIPDYVFNTMFVLGLVIIGYHSYRAYNKLKENKSAWVNWIHIFLVAPLFMIIGYLKNDASRRYFEMLMMLGFAATGYHAFYLMREMMLL